MKTSVIEIIGALAWAAAFAVFYDTDRETKALSWCQCITESEGTDMDLELCDARHDPYLRFTYEQDCVRKGF